MQRTTITIYKGRRTMSINRSKLAYYKAHGWRDAPDVKGSVAKKAPEKASNKPPK